MVAFIKNHYCCHFLFSWVHSSMKLPGLMNWAFYFFLCPTDYPYQHGILGRRLKLVYYILQLLGNGPLFFNHGYYDGNSFKDRFISYWVEWSFVELSRTELMVREEIVSRFIWNQPYTHEVVLDINAKRLDRRCRRVLTYMRTQAHTHVYTQPCLL
jgi:hypothetical protein